MLIYHLYTNFGKLSKSFVYFCNYFFSLTVLLYTRDKSFITYLQLFPNQWCVYLINTFKRSIFLLWSPRYQCFRNYIFTKNKLWKKKPYFFCFLSTRDFYELLSRYKRNLIICIQYEYPVVCWCSHYCTAPYIPI